MRKTVLWNPVVAIAFIGLFLSVIMKSTHNMENNNMVWGQYAAMKGAGFGVEQLNLKVMTYNIRHGRGMDNKVNLDRIAEDIRKSMADIVALQEVDRFNFRSGFRDQAKLLADRLDMHWCFATSMRWGFMQYGNAILSRFPIEHSEVYTLPGMKERRTLLKAVVRIGDRRVNVYTTHLGVGLQERELQLPIIADILAEDEGPSIFMGDLNMESSHVLVSSLLSDWYKLGLTAKTGTVLSGLEIDHIFVNPMPYQASAWTMSSVASDHNPVVAELLWSAQSRAMLAVAE
jgi:Metal-dependent hydrolase